MGSAIAVHVEHIQDGLKELPPFLHFAIYDFPQTKRNNSRATLEISHTLGLSFSLYVLLFAFSYFLTRLRFPFTLSRVGGEKTISGGWLDDSAELRCSTLPLSHLPLARVGAE